MAARPAAIITLAGTLAFAQGPAPIQEGTAGQRVDVPPINQRIAIAPLEEGPGAFTTARGTRASRIFGVVIDDLGMIVPSAGFVVVRSLEDGNAVGQAQVDTLGQFNLTGVEPGLYTAELLDPAGTVIVSSPSFTVGIGQFVQLTPVVPRASLGGFGSVLGSGTAGALHAAVNAGVLAVETPAPISP